MPNAQPNIFAVAVYQMEIIASNDFKDVTEDDLYLIAAVANVPNAENQERAVSYLARAMEVAPDAVKTAFMSHYDLPVDVYKVMLGLTPRRDIQPRTPQEVMQAFAGHFYIEPPAAPAPQVPATEGGAPR